MGLRNTEQSYGLVSKWLHWLIALLILGLIWLGWVMVDLGYYDPWYHDALVTHRALGMAVLVLVVLKLVWKLISPNPLAQAELKSWEVVSSKCVHWFLVAMMFLIPITGYLISSSEGAAIPFFSWFDIPALFEVSEELRDLAIVIHYYTAYGVFFLVLMHAGAAIKHQFIDRHGTLKRML